MTTHPEDRADQPAGATVLSAAPDEAVHRSREAGYPPPAPVAEVGRSTGPVADEGRSAGPVADPDDAAWTTLQGAFVDDPAQAVRDAADRVAEQLATYRARLGSADTEQLRTAFKQFRDLSRTLR